MKKITLMIFVSLMSFFAYSQGLPLYQFEDAWVQGAFGTNPAPPDWVVINAEGPNRWWVPTIPGNTAQPPLGGTGYSAYLDRETAAPSMPIPSDYLISKRFTVPANGELRFWSRLTLGTDNGGIYRIYIAPFADDATAPTVANMTGAGSAMLKQYTELELNPIQTEWTEKTLSIPAAWAGQSVRIAFQMEGSNKDRWFIDDVSLLPVCVAPTNPVVTATTSTSATLNWTNTTSTSWEIEVVPDTATPTGVGVTYNGGLPYTINNLTPCQQYKYYVRANCGGGAKSVWVGPTFFKARCLGETCADPIVIPAGTSYSTTNNTANFADFYEGVAGTGCNSTGNYLAGNDVVYAFTPTATGNYNLNLSGTGGPAGMFIYSSCANIGTACLNGALASATVAANIPAMSLTAGTTYYVVISTNATPQTTNYTLTIQQVFCPQPTAGAASNITGSSANLTWTAGTPGATSWQVAVQTAGSGLPSTGATVSSNTGYGVSATSAGVPFTPATAYEFYVRESCAGGQFSIWSGPYPFTTTQVPASLNFVQNFDTATPHGFILANGTQSNKWVVGNATNNSPASSLYISNDNGATNNYNQNSASVVHAYRDIQMPAAVGQLSLTFDWKAFGESCCDYLRVWIVPATFTPTTGTQITAASGGTQIGGNLNNSTAWQTSTTILSPTGWDGTTKRLVFEWRNDGDTGGSPSGAIDNINFAIITCPQPVNLTVGTLTPTQGTVNWTAPAIVPASYDVYVSENAVVPPVATTTPTIDNVPGTTANIPLTASSVYYVWVRSDCSPTDKSFWTGPVTFTTPQIPDVMPYNQNFDSGNPHLFTLNNGTQTNKWVVGTAASSSPASSLYVTDSPTGATNTYTHVLTRVHAYRDIQLPATIPSGQLLLKFDWRNIGENNQDFVRVWIVPLSYAPTPGTQITAAASGGVQVGGNFQLSANWTTANNIVAAPAAWNGTVRRVIFEWSNNGSGGSNPPGAIDNIEFSVVTCSPPTALTVGALTTSSATINWTAPATVPAGYDYYYSTTTTPPTPTTTPNGSVTPATATINGLTDSTNYNVWVRSNCGGTAGTSIWVGPLNFNTPQIPATMPYAQNFDTGVHSFTLANGTQTNKWHVGSAVSNSPANSLYISADGGATHNYTLNSTTVVHAYRDIQLPASLPTGQIQLQFDWMNQGEAIGTTLYDYIRVYITPVTFTPTPGTQITASATNLKIGGDLLLNSSWITANNTVTIPATWVNTPRRVIFEWRNDISGGTPPPGAIDNIIMKAITCVSPSNLVAGSIDATGATFNWTAPVPAPASYDYYLTTSPTPPVDGTVPTGNTTGTTITLAGLPDSTNYYLWIRSNCGATDGTSYWVGGVNFNTPQIPAVLPYNETFDAGNPKYSFVHSTVPNKWVIGGATFSSPSTSMYISNDNGVTNNFTNNVATVAHSFRDVAIPMGVTTLDLAFDWKNAGDTNDFLRVWMVPTTFNPVSGTAITAAADRVLVTTTNLFGSNTWKNATYAVPVTGGTNQRFVFQWVSNASTGTTAGAIDNVSIKVLTCPKPTAQTVAAAGMTTAQLGWTEAGTATNWDVYVVPEGGNPPSLTEEGVDAPTNPFTYPGLTPATYYEFYVRANCGPGDDSRWTGPFRFNTNNCEVEDQCTFDFILTDSGNNGWQGTRMNVLQGGLTIAVLGPQLTAGGGPVTVSVPLCEGIPYDVFFVDQYPTTTNAQQSGLEIVNPLTGQTVFQRIAGTPAYDQNTIIYTGISSCSVITCPQPTNLASTSVVNAANTTELTWTPGATETQWEVVVQGEGDGFPSNTPANGVLVYDEPSHVVDGLVPSEPYEFYVRAICGPDEKSFWSGPLKYSIFTPPACADVTVVDDDSLEVIAPDTEYVICPGEELCVNFSAEFYVSAAQTTSYEITSIPFLPPFPTLGGTEMPVSRDDMWSPRINLPFEFCFMGNVYNAAQVGSNGVVTFDANNAYGAFSPWAYTQSLPNAAFPIKNAILGVYQDTDPRPELNTWDNPNINYQVLGNYPCRALVVSFNELAQYGCSGNNAADEAIGKQSSQIVIYEITNIIEVYVKRRVACTGHNSGSGVIGLVNTTGTQAYVPPGRNTGTWSAADEAWRFTPNGDTSVVFEWLKNGDFFSNSSSIEVCSTGPGTTVMTARASYGLCTGENAVRESNFTIKVEELIVPDVDPVDISKCGNGEDVTFNLNLAVEDAFTDVADYEFTFFATEQDAIDNQNSIPSAFVTNATTTIWVRINRVNSPCFITRSFEAIVANVAPVFGITPGTSVCDGTSATIAVVPDPTEDLSTATYAWTVDGNPLPDTTASITVTAAGEYQVTVNKNGCVGTATSTLAVVPVPVAEAIADAEVCGDFTLPEFVNPDNNNANAYYTGPGATGTALSPGDIIGENTTVSMPAGTYTIYVYSTNTDGVATCTDESSFTVTVADPIAFTQIPDVNACDSYELPALTGEYAGASYWTGTGATGTQLNAGDEITTATQLIYVYRVDGPCTGETSFTVNVSATPVLTTPADVNECDSYMLPALTVGNYYEEAGGVSPIDVTQPVTTNKLIYIYATSPDNAACFAQTSFTVNITNTPQFNLGGPYRSCVASNMTITVNPTNFAVGDATYTWTFEGAPVGTNSPSIVPADGAFGTYEVTVTIGQCSNTLSIEVEQDTDAIELTFDDNCVGGAYYLEVIDVDGSFNPDTATYEWVGPEGFSSTDRQIVPPVQGEYIVTVTTADGCVAIDSFEVLSTTCEIPRGISPNGDGKNDNFDLAALGVRHLSIFNRYGQEVYSKGNYTNEWHGQGKGGEELPTGTYFYMVERTNGESKTGWVYINRQQ